MNIMKNKSITKHKLTHLSLCLFAALSPQLLHAEEASQAKKEAEVERIIVVGSQIKGSAITETLPVTQLTSEDMEISGALDGDELLRSIPQIGAVGFTSTRGGNTGTNAARGDVGSVNLRSIGEGNTLVLLNGRRMVNHPITQTDFGVPVTSVNSNTLPVSGLNRVDVLRDGAGALYGSDAVAGVVNYVTKTDYENGEIQIKYGAEHSTSRDDFTLSASQGFEFNDGATFFLLSGNYARKNGLMASEKDFASNQDLRSRAPEEFAGNTNFDNRSSLEPFARVNYEGLGLFHVRPTDFVRDNGSQWDLSDCGGRGIDPSMSQFNDGLQDLCLDSSGQDRAMRPNRNEDRTLVPDIDRINLFTNLSHEFDNDIEFYNESTYYRSVAKRQWEQSAILSNGRFDVAADYYWNPLGPVNFTDGRVNPNRIAGLDTSIVPVEGLGFNLNSLRPTDVGPRQVEVTSTSYRFLNGLRGQWNDWDWDTGILYSEAETEDTARNRISSPLFMAQINLDTPDAYNIFTGVNPNNTASIQDSTPNPQSSINPFLTSATRNAKTSLSLFDFKVSNPELFSLPAGDVGAAFGIEFRKETIDENNSAIFDGSTPFVEGSATPSNPSSLEGSSVRPDVKADRSVFSAYAEFVVPLLRDIPLVHSLDMQLAARYEDFDDVGNITRPKMALSWFPVENVQVRGAISKGFRAPNLIQLNSPGTSLTTSVRDYAEGILSGSGDVNSGPSNGNYILETSGNQDLVPEESENISLGIVLTPVDNLILTADWWEIETTNTVGVFTDENESRLDAVLRAQGSFNERVIRGPIDEDNPLGEIVRIQRSYQNLNTRTVSGLDLSVLYDIDTSVGSFGFKINGAKTISFEQEAAGDALKLVEFGADPEVLGSNIGELAGTGSIPEWRATASINWKSTDNLWRAGVFVSYVGEVKDTSIFNQDDQGNKTFFVSESVTRTNLTLTKYDFFAEDLSLTLGMNNAFDVDPALADTTFGYDGSLQSSRGRYTYLSARYKF